MVFSIKDKIILLALSNDGCILYRDLIKILAEEGVSKGMVYESVKRLKRMGYVYTKYSVKGKWVSEKEVCVKVPLFLIRSTQRLLRLMQESA